jgi:hypothetical protein
MFFNPVMAQGGITLEEIEKVLEGYSGHKHEQFLKDHEHGIANRRPL